MLNDEQLKQLLRQDPSPPLSAPFAERALARVLPAKVVAGRQFQWNLAGLGGVLGRRPSAAWRPWVWMLAAVALAWWAQTHVLQAPGDDDLLKIDSVGMSSLLTL
ncbi:MAG: hypothetical protein RIT26_802 [Pseudomonadota bacterium]|jgi:hypothetical protein